MSASDNAWIVCIAQGKELHSKGSITTHVFGVSRGEHINHGRSIVRMGTNENSYTVFLPVQSLLRFSAGKRELLYG